jgi:uncharacterized protein YjbI with pentapeptide repeats
MQVDLRGADLSGAYLDGADLKGANPQRSPERTHLRSPELTR